MSSDFKGPVKSCKVKGNQKALSLVLFRARPRRLESLTWKDSARDKKEPSYYPHSIFTVKEDHF